MCVCGIFPQSVSAAIINSGEEKTGARGESGGLSVSCLGFRAREEEEAEGDLSAVLFVYDGKLPDIPRPRLPPDPPTHSHLPRQGQLSFPLPCPAPTPTPSPALRLCVSLAPHAVTCCWGFKRVPLLERNRAVEHGLFRGGIKVHNKVAHALQLEGLAGCS